MQTQNNVQNATSKSQSILPKLIPTTLNSENDPITFNTGFEKSTPDLYEKCTLPSPSSGVPDISPMSFRSILFSSV